jgi:hypothetical protein
MVAISSIQDGIRSPCLASYTTASPCISPRTSHTVRCVGKQVVVADPDQMFLHSQKVAMHFVTGRTLFAVFAFDEDTVFMAAWKGIDSIR